MSNDISLYILGNPFQAIVLLRDAIRDGLARLTANRDEKLVARYGQVEVIAKPAKAESPDERYLRHWQNWQISASLCVTKSTALTYSSGVASFLTWCASCDVDPTFTVVPYAYDAQIAVFEHRVTSFLNFLGYLAYDLELDPKTVTVYKCAVINWFKCRLVDHAFMQHEAVSQLYSSLVIHWNANHEQQTRRRLPFTLEMLTAMCQKTLNLSLAKDRAVMIATKIALVIMSRQSELIPTADKHFLRADDVHFTFAVRTGGPDVSRPSRLAFTSDIGELTGVTLNVRSAKNDQEGLGNRYHFEVIPVSEDVAFCLATDMFRWAEEARHQEGDPFVSYRGVDYAVAPWWLSYYRLNAAVKAAATACGFDGERFSTHSLRIGGATIMAAAGLPNHYIQKMGRWKSLTFLGYIHVAMGVMDSSLRAVVRPGWFTNAQLRVLNP